MPDFEPFPWKAQGAVVYDANGMRVADTWPEFYSDRMNNANSPPNTPLADFIAKAGNALAERGGK